MKYKVGDKVRARKDLELEEHSKTSPGVNEEMVELAGKIFTIKSTNTCWHTAYLVKENVYSWTDDMLEPVDNEGEWKSKSKFKVGDKVRVVKNLYSLDDISSVGVMSGMFVMEGSVVTILEVGKSWNTEKHMYHIVEDKEEYWWGEDMLEPIDSGTFPSFAEIVEKTGIKKGDRVLINGYELTFTGEVFVDNSGKKINTRILGSDFKILPKPKTGAEILAHLKELRGDWEPDWNDEDESKYIAAYDYHHKQWNIQAWMRWEIVGVLVFSEETSGKVKEYLNTLTEEESMNLLKEMRI